MGVRRTQKKTVKGAPPRHTPHEAMLQMLGGYWVSQLVFVVAKLGVADELRRGPATAEALAKRVGAHAPFLYRVLRALASCGVFAETTNGRFKLTPLAATLRSDAPASLRDFAAMVVEGYNWRAWGELLHGVRTGEQPFDHVHGVPAFEWLAQHPEDERIFAAAMASISGTENEAIARAYPFGELRTLVDVGGAHGHLLATILRRHRRLRGILFDQPQVVEAAARGGYLAPPDIATRCEIQGGSFFDTVPTGADGYLMKYILHDWDDERALRILRNCREAMAPGGRVLLAEHIIEPGNRPDFGKLLDINMLVIAPGGLERTREEFRELLARAGLRLRRVVPTTSRMNILEGVAA
jgi:O-methyltransferase domain/Dimerisation domain